MSWYTFFEILLYLVAATLLGVGVGWVLHSGRATPSPTPAGDPETEARLRRERDSARAEAAARAVEIRALVDEVAALRRAAVADVDDPDEPSPAGTLDAWPPPDEHPEPAGEVDPNMKAAYDDLRVLVVHLRQKLFEATRESRQAVEERESLAVELRTLRKAREAQVDADVRLEVALAERDAEIEALRARLDGSHAEVDDHAEQVGRLNDKLAAVHARVEALESELRSVADERDNAQEWGEAVQAEVASLKAVVEAWEQRKADLDAALEAFRAPMRPRPVEPERG